MIYLYNEVTKTPNTESQVQWIGVPFGETGPCTSLHPGEPFWGQRRSAHNHLMQISSDVPAKAQVGPAAGGQCVPEGGDDTKKELLWPWPWVQMHSHTSEESWVGTPWSLQPERRAFNPPPPRPSSDGCSSGRSAGSLGHFRAQVAKGIGVRASGDPTQQPCALRPQDTNLSRANPHGWQRGQLRVAGQCLMVLTAHRISPRSLAHPWGQASKPPLAPLPWHRALPPTTHLPSNFVQLQSFCFCKMCSLSTWQLLSIHCTKNCLVACELSWRTPHLLSCFCWDPSSPRSTEDQKDQKSYSGVSALNFLVSLYEAYIHPGPQPCTPSNQPAPSLPAPTFSSFQYHCLLWFLDLPGSSLLPWVLCTHSHFPGVLTPGFQISASFCTSLSTGGSHHCFTASHVLFPFLFTSVFPTPLLNCGHSEDRTTCVIAECMWAKHLKH